MRSQADKGADFQALHQADGLFVLPNPWDIGSARMLAAMGYRALATTSAGMAWSMGLGDSGVSFASLMEHCRMLSSATDLPLAADLEDCFAATPEGVGDAIRDSAKAGLVGGSVEDWAPGRNGEAAGIRGIEAAAERVQAAAEAAKGLNFPFTLSARAENHIRGVTNLADTIQRLQAYQEAGADVLYAPGLRTLEDIASVVRAVDRPLNVLMGSATGLFTLAQLAEIGVKRVSLGGAFAGAAYNAFLRAAMEVKEQGSFTFREESKAPVKIMDLLGE